MLFDLQSDPEEFIDLAKDSTRTPEIDVEIERLYAHLFTWARRMSQRVTKSEDDIIAMRGRSLRRGILPFLADGTEVPEDLTQFYTGKAKADYTGES
jgi:hypothetical protein